ncbi:MAG: chitobiase/beta-hexosaminidase C-terminal domain-containing protein [Muribaculaceae bacterium]|nr:chitobiase/beta-hexosaminidase C-terminal domain-containing protein [Muribaculaceae bacterium]
MKKLLTLLLLTVFFTLQMQGDEVTLKFADLGLDNNASLTDYKVNDNISISSTGNSRWNDTNKDFRLFSTGGFTVTITDATLTGINIACNSGYGFGALSSVTADSASSDFTANPFSWTGEATESWSVTATPAAANVRVESITFIYTPKAVSETITQTFLCKDMGLANMEAMSTGGYDANEYINIDFAKGTHSSQPTYREAVEGFYLFNGQQVIVTAKNGAKLLNILVSTQSSNPFGYIGSITADGVLQTFDTDYTWVPCEWHGSAEQSVVIQNGLTSGNTRVTGLTITYETPGDGPAVSRPVITPSETDNTISITCDTEGATVYYTTDGTDPSAENGSIYEQPFTLSEACTVKAIAILDGVSSSVASLEVYMRIVDSLEAFLANRSPKEVTINCPVTAIVHKGSYLLVKDNKGSYAIVYNTNPDLNEALNVDNGTTWANMKAIFEPYGDYGYVKPAELGAVTQEEPVQPRVVTIPDFKNCSQFEYVTLQRVSFTPGSLYQTYTDTDGNELDGRNRFVISLPSNSDADTKYDFTGVAYQDPEYPDEPELWPTSYVVNTNSGIETISEDYSGALYFNAQGIQVKHPEKGGIYIVVKNGNANKVVVQ